VKQWHFHRFLIPGDPGLTIERVKGGEAMQLDHRTRAALRVNDQHVSATATSDTGNLRQRARLVRAKRRPDV
jgi:hypothetical protein